MMKILQVLLHLALFAFEVICYGTFTILGAINEREQVASTGGLLVGSLGISAAFNRHTFGGLMGAASARQSVQSLLHISSVLDRSHQHSVPFGLLGEEISPLGEVFGWIMAVIYMGGRLPQIWLNIKRGTAEGLNPLMFMFALVGNITYVGSILVRSTEWSQLKPNLPWLVDAGVCVVLDTFVSSH
jgi:uncharacterized protein with PQ loop repeat